MNTNRQTDLSVLSVQSVQKRSETDLSVLSVQSVQKRSETGWIGETGGGELCHFILHECAEMVAG